ncbi:MAG: glycosyltransferase [Candidatus Marinimicrobia bacterium]|nr:glycosyltransferase [Candidatus Neomarinimicrobiota bacterium]MCF7828822.1 glycosyltransferase [Candidatus Neomarinimicrobiota bacterium]MCF7880739.1 glycosyltransferase [Candidatus Neomarinimicrobiota bacterium]
MAKIIFTNIPEPNHLFPIIPFGQEFVDRGHRVQLATGRQFRQLISQAGLDFAEIGVFEDFTVRNSPDGFEDLYDSLINITKQYVEEYLSLFRETEPDLIVTGSLDYGAAIAAENFGAPWIVLANNPGMLEPEGSLPYTGRGISGAGIKTNIIRYFHRRFLARYSEPLNQIRKKQGLDQIENPFTTQMVRADEYLALAFQSMEPGEPAFPDVVDFAGPVCWRPDGDGSDWDWINGLQSPVVLVPLNEVDTPDNHVLVKRLVEGVGDTNLSVIIESEKEFQTINWPENFVKKDRLHLDSLLPEIHLMIHRGNYLAYAQAVREGLPSIIVSSNAESRENAVRAEQAGIAKVTDIDGFRSGKIGEMISELLREPLYRMMTERLKEQLRGRGIAGEVATNLISRYNF